MVTGSNPIEKTLKANDFIPAFIVCTLYFIKELNFKKIITISWPYFLITIIYFLFRLKFFSLQRSFKSTLSVLPNFDTYISNLYELIVWYISKLIIPHDIIFLWTTEASSEFFIIAIISVLTALCILIYFIVFHWKTGIKSFALSVFSIGLLPVTMTSFSYWPKVNPMIEPHWFYFSSIGFFMLIAMGILKIKEKINLNVWKLIILIIIGSNFLLLRQNNNHWQNEESYCRYWLKLNPRNITPFYGLGYSLLQKGQYQEAVNTFMTGIKTTEIYNWTILSDLGFAHFQLGEHDKALKYYQQALKVAPYYSVVHYYISHYYFKFEKYDQAKEAIINALHLFPTKTAYQQLFIKISQKLETSN